MAYDAGLTPPSLPQLQSPPPPPPPLLPPSLPPTAPIPPGPVAPGSVFDTGLKSTPLLPQPIWQQDGGTSTQAQPLVQTQALTPPPWTPQPPPAPYQPDQGQQAVAFESAVRAEIKQLESYFTRQTKRFRLLGVATLVCAAAVPVLIAAGVWSWIAAALGAIAAISGSLQTLYRYQDSALSAMSLSNNLESEVVRYQTGTTPYSPGAPTNFNLFVDRVTDLRGEASASFNGVWNSAKISTGG